MTIDKNLWGTSRLARLESARALSKSEIKALQDNLCGGCPVALWPYGNPTSINPLLVTLGVSPGNSPSAGDVDFLRRGAQDMPTAGVPHPGTYYQDTKGYWDRVRFLASACLRPAEGSDSDALSLLGNLNLDPGSSGKAEDVAVEGLFASWILEIIRDHLRPRFLVLLGLKTYLEKNPYVHDLIANHFDRFQLSRPEKVHPFIGYTEKQMSFREWDVVGPAGNQVKIILWPQHPSRAPFSNFALWKASCEEFVSRHGNLLN